MTVSLLIIYFYYLLKMKQYIKKITPKILWQWMRRQKILCTHHKASQFCNALIDAYENKPIRYSFLQKKRISQKVIWQYWGQGYDNVPEVVKICLESVDKYKGDCQLVRLTDKNISEYLDLPNFVLKKRELFPHAFFSDLLRCLLLSTYGGVWLDATILLTGPLPDRYFDMDFFMFQRAKDEVNQSYWENTFAYYYGWYNGFKVNVLNSVFFGKREANIVKEISKYLLFFWEYETKLPDYFFFQILFNQLIEKHPEWNCTIESDCLPHYVMQMLTDNFSYLSFKETIALTNIHKMTYKMPEKHVAKLKELLNSIN